MSLTRAELPEAIRKRCFDAAQIPPLPAALEEQNHSFQPNPTQTITSPTTTGRISTWPTQCAQWVRNRTCLFGHTVPDTL
jgi:hypothetical protein